ncbi:MAG: right-handed parallel beta-helix repeat-containing protein [Clostridia bacterium]|nr:right-handed parallel beta-helix repeat-containing protein [Clostridia bacterium]
MDVRVTANERLSEVFKSVKSGDTVYLEKGVYREDSPTEIYGKENITVKGKGAVITGCAVIDGVRSKYGESAYLIKTRRGLDIQQLFVNGKKYVMARYPNERENEILGGYSPDTVSAERIARWKNPSGGYLRALHDCEWGGNDWFIDGKNTDGTLKLRWVGDNNRGSGFHREKVMVENIFEELDAPKEWFYDKENGFLYIIPDGGDDMLSATVEGAVCGEIFMLKNCKNVSFSGIRFENTKRMLFCSEYEKITRSDWAVARNGAVYMNNCENVSVIDCAFSGVGGNCVFVDGKNSDISVVNCDFSDCGASGVCVFGNQNCVRDLSKWGNHKTVISDFEKGPKSDLYPKDVLIKDCYFYNLGIYEKQSSPVTVSVCSRVTVDGCTIHKVPRAGINICDGSFGGHRIQNNLVFDTVLETGDHGPFNSWGRDRFWSLGGVDGGGKNGAEKRPFATLDAVETTVIYHNMFCGNRGFGIDLDDGSSNYLIEKNYCVGVGIKLREGFLRTVRNNFVLNAPLDIHCTFEKNDDVIENNIVVSKNPLSVYAQNKGFTTKAANNLFVGASDDILSDELFCDNKNYVCDANDINALEMLPKEIFFEPVEMKFGRRDKPKPETAVKTGAETALTETDGMVLILPDESVRSMAGLSGFEGAFVKAISQNSPFYLLGVRENDVIIEINGKKTVSPKDVDGKHGINSVAVSRAQKIIEFKKDEQ